jgi:integrase
MEYPRVSKPSPHRGRPNKWKINIDLARGKETSTIVTGDHETAMARYYELKKEMEKGVWRAPSEITLIDYAERMIEIRATTENGRSTTETYQAQLRRYATPYFGDRRLQKVSGSEIQALYTKLAKEGIAACTVRILHTVLKLTYRMAMTAKIDGTALLAFNPMDEVRPPRLEKKRGKDKAISRDAQELLLREVWGHELADALRFLSWTGMRRGEVLGLKWDAVTLDGPRPLARVIRKKVQLPLSRAVALLDGAKSEAGRRVFPLTATAVEMLRRRRLVAMQAALVAGHKVADQFVFGDVDPLRFTRFVSYWGRKLNLDISPHTMRHSFASDMSQAGMPLEDLAKLLGHHSASFTLDNYCHSSDASLDRAVALAEQVMPTGNTNKSGNVTKL